MNDISTRAHDAQGRAVHMHGSTDSGFGHRRQHHDVQRRQRRPVAPLPFSDPGPRCADWRGAMETEVWLCILPEL